MVSQEIIKSLTDDISLKVPIGKGTEPEKEIEVFVSPVYVADESGDEKFKGLLVFTGYGYDLELKHKEEFALAYEKGFTCQYEEDNCWVTFNPIASDLLKECMVRSYVILQQIIWDNIEVEVSVRYTPLIGRPAIAVVSGYHAVNGIYSDKEENFKPVRCMKFYSCGAGDYSDRRRCVTLNMPKFGLIGEIPPGKIAIKYESDMFKDVDICLDTNTKIDELNEYGKPLNRAERRALKKGGSMALDEVRDKGNKHTSFYGGNKGQSKYNNPASFSGCGGVKKRQKSK